MTKVNVKALAPKHEKGDARRVKDQGGEKGDARRPYQRTDPKKGGLPPVPVDPCSAHSKSCAGRDYVDN